MGIKTTIAVSLLFAAASAPAATNSWIYTGLQGGNYFWDIGTSWSLTVRPAITDDGDFITNTTTKTVAMDSFDSGTPAVTNSLAVSNLTVGADAGITNTLFLSSMGTNVPLRLFNSLTIASGGVLKITNSVLRVDGVAGGIFEMDGTMQIFPRADIEAKNATIGNSALLQFALGSNTSPIVISNNLTIGGTVNVTDGGGFTNTTYTLFAYLGSLVNNGLAVGSLPTNFTATIDTSTAGQVNLVVGQVVIPPAISSFHFITIARNTNDVILTWLATGGTTNAIQATSGTANGSFNTNNFADISSQIVILGSGSVTNIYTDTNGATNAPSRFYRVRLVP